MIMMIIERREGGMMMTLNEKSVELMLLWFVLRMTPIIMHIIIIIQRMVLNGNSSLHLLMHAFLKSLLPIYSYSCTLSLCIFITSYTPFLLTSCFLFSGFKINKTCGRNFQCLPPVSYWPCFLLSLLERKLQFHDMIASENSHPLTLQRDCPISWVVSSLIHGLLYPELNACVHSLPTEIKSPKKGVLLEWTPGKSLIDMDRIKKKDCPPPPPQVTVRWRRAHLFSSMILVVVWLAHETTTWTPCVLLFQDPFVMGLILTSSCRLSWLISLWCSFSWRRLLNTRHGLDPGHLSCILFLSTHASLSVLYLCCCSESGTRLLPFLV